MASVVEASPLLSIDMEATEVAATDDGTATWSDFDVGELLRACEAELLLENEIKAEHVEKAKKEALKDRHRKNMENARSRRKQLMDRMRKQHQYLSKKLENGVDAWKRLREETAAYEGVQPNSSAERVEDGGYTSSSSCSTVAEMPSVSHAQLYAKYVTAVEEENAIHRENEALRQRLEQLDLFEAVLRVDTPVVDVPVTLENPSKKPPGRRGPLNRPGYWSYFAQDTEPFYYVPMTEQQCHLLIRNMYKSSQTHHMHFVTQLTQQHARDRVQFFGWTVQRSVTDGAKFHFHFTKTFPCSDNSALADQMADEGWRVFNSPERYKKLFRTAMDVRVLQRVDAFNSVILRNSPNANRSQRTRHLTLMSKISDVDARGQKSLAILTLVMQPPEDAANFDGSDVRFIRDGYTYLRFDMCVGGVKFTYGGRGDLLHPSLAKYLFVETGNILLRFEQMVFPSNLVTFS